MNMYEMIRKKRDGGKLSSEEVNLWIKGYVKGDIPDYQSAAMLMAMFLRGLDKEETVALTLAMLDSGETVDLTDIPGVKVDKHSTGGVGDKTSLIVAPLAAAAGLKVAKMSGRGLGHTGGTVDKLESIPGFRTELSQKEFCRVVNQCGLSIISQSQDLVPADKLLYALREVTATIDSIPLIAASIMSKKLAVGADIILLDIKYGAGAFMKTFAEAKELARVMVEIGSSRGKEIAGILSAMEEPLGYAVGNALEVAEAAKVLQGGGPEDLRQLCLILTGEMLLMGNQANTLAQGERMAAALLDNGDGWAKFLEMVAAQGGDTVALQESGGLPQAAYIRPVLAKRSGHIQAMDAEKIGFAALLLGAGRQVRGEKIDAAAGIILNKKIGDPVEEGEPLAFLHTATAQQYEKGAEAFLSAIVIDNKAKPSKEPLVAGVLDKNGFTSFL